jgi:hypothetical protein
MAVSELHIHKCCVHECETLVECPGPCREGEVPVRPVCDVHLPMWIALDKALDEAGYTEDGKYWYLDGVRQAKIPKLF